MTDKSEKDTSKLHEQPADADEIRDVMDDSTADTAVSYTHLTLPTKA